MQLEQLELKFFAQSDGTDEGIGDGIDPGDLISVFHRWIRDAALGEDITLIDVVDYRHIVRGPGVVLIGHGHQLRWDTADGRPGLLYARKRDGPGDAGTKLRDALRRGLDACAALEREPVLSGGLRFRTDQVQVTVMSRLVADNTDLSLRRLRRELLPVASTLYPQGSATIERAHEDHRRPLSALIRAPAAPPLAALRARL